MRHEHRYRLRTTWIGDRSAGAARSYGRDVRIDIEGKPSLEASADAPFHGDPRKWNPEDLLLSALSQCHLLSYLYACTRVGVTVVSYHDDAAGMMAMDGTGAGAFEEVLLRPHVVVAHEEMREAALEAHAEARRMCVIANSVTFPVRHLPTVEVAAGR